MRVLVVSHVWEPESGTPQRRWAWLAGALTAAGHEVDVLAPPPHYPTGKLLDHSGRFAPGTVAPGENGETIWRTAFREHDPTLPSRTIDQAVTMRSQISIGARVITRRRPDIIVATAPPLPAATAAMTLARKAHLPYILDLRDVWPDLLRYMNQWSATTGRSDPGSPLKRSLFHTVARVGGLSTTRAIRRASGIVTTTSSFADLLHSRGTENTLVLRNLGATREIEMDPAPLDSPTLNILYAGTTGRAQELENALRALADVRKRGADVRMRVVGSGAHLKTLRHNAETLDIPVEFTGRILFDEVTKHYRWADTVLVHLQNWDPLDYTVPSKLYEVLEIGRHISLSVNGEAARIVRVAHAGDVVPAMDRKALSQLWWDLAHDRSRLRVGDGGRQWLAAQGTPTENGQRLVDFLQETVERYEDRREGHREDRHQERGTA